MPSAVELLSNSAICKSDWILPTASLFIMFVAEKSASSVYSSFHLFVDIFYCLFVNNQAASLNQFPLNLF